MTPDQFESAVLAAFAEPVTTFGLKHIETRVHTPECWVVLAGTGVQVVVHLELDRDVWTVLVRTDAKGLVVQEVGLDYISERLMAPAPSIEARLKDQAERVTRSASSLLRGDLNAWGRLSQ